MLTSRTVLIGILGAVLGGCANEMAGQAPDYLVMTVTDPPGMALVGDRFVVTTTVRNDGTADATLESGTRYSLSIDPLSNGDRQFEQTLLVPPLAVGASHMQDITLRVPSVAAGTYYVIACANRDAVITELDDRNNCTATARPVIVRDADQVGADLVVDSVTSPPATLAVGDPLSLTDTTRNVGTVDVDQSAVRYFLSPSTTRGPDAVPLEPQRNTGAIPAGGTSTGTVTGSVPSVAPGTYFVLACADVSDQILETDDTNNCTASANPVMVMVAVADLVVDSVTSPPATLAVGDPVSLTDTTRNVGTADVDHSAVG